jgi:hypothetical protein
MRSPALSGALVIAVMLTGCARAHVETAIRADGSWVRTLTFTGQEPKAEGMQVTPVLDETFVMPKGGGWKTVEEKKADGVVAITLERAVAAGGSLEGDISIKDSKAPGKLRMVNEVTVKRTAPHQFEYRERLQWKGDPASKLLGDIKPEDLGKIKAALPKPLATDDNARALANTVAELAVPVLFGPGDPLLAIGMLHPDLAVYRANQRLGVLMMKALDQQFGDKLTPAERREVARRLIQDTFSSSKLSQPDPKAAATPSGTNTGLTPLIFIVKAPGRVVSSNGELDEFSGDVFWALFEEAASFKDVVLTAVVEVN